MPNHNSILNDAISNLSEKEHIKEVYMMIFDNSDGHLDDEEIHIKYEMPNIPYLLCELDCPKDCPQACHIYMASDGEELIVAGELALDFLDGDNYEIAETIAEDHHLQIIEDLIGKNKVFSERVPLELYKSDLYASVLNVAKAERELSEPKRA